MRHGSRPFWALTPPFRSCEGFTLLSLFLSHVTSFVGLIFRDYRLSSIFQRPIHGDDLVALAALLAGETGAESVVRLLWPRLVIMEPQALAHFCCVGVGNLVGFLLSPAS